MKAVLFDLDGTLLDIDIARFLPTYYRALREVDLGANGSLTDPDRVLNAIIAGARAMHGVHPDRTNLDVFCENFTEATGVAFEDVWAVYERFYAEVFPNLQGDAKPAKGAREAVETARRLGLRVAVATNPIFPRIAIDHRLRWAGLDDIDFDVVTTYEQMTACKPHGAYFRQTAELLSVKPADCLMVGDDASLDLPAADIGMRTYYVGSERKAVADARGSLMNLARLLPVLTGSR